MKVKEEKRKETKKKLEKRKPIEPSQNWREAHRKTCELGRVVRFVRCEWVRVWLISIDLRGR